MMKKGDFKKSITFPSIFLILSIVAAIFYRACRVNWVFTDKTIGFEGFSILLLTLIVLNALALSGLVIGRIYTKNSASPFFDKKIYSVALISLCAFASIFFIFALIYSLGIVLSESRHVYLLYLKQTIIEGLPLFVVPFFAIIFPKLNCKVKKAVCVLAFVLVICFGINSFFPLSQYKITSVPLVIDNGSEYSIVFSTNDNGTGYAEYTYEGKDYKVFDNTGGRINSDQKIHSIVIPYEHLRNNTYKIGSTRVIEEFSYGSRRGKTVTSDEYNFVYNNSHNQTWLVLSDWHTMLKKAYTAADNLRSDYDGVILLGDASPGVDFEEQVIRNIVQFGGEVSKGEKPVIYVRGNHETRGSYAKDLPEALGLEQFYYTTDIGPYSFIVLDSGEDKDDSHIEYGGMNDYNTYRTDMIEWLKGVNAANEKVIALSHSWKISDVEQELSQEGWAQLNRIGTRLLISGHEHKCRYLGDGNDKEKELMEKYPDIIGYIDGGKIEENFVASLLTLNENGFEIKAVNNNNEDFGSKKFNW